MKHQGPAAQDCLLPSDLLPTVVSTATAEFLIPQSIALKTSTASTSKGATYCYCLLKQQLQSALRMNIIFGAY
jgi:hypothetical protein